DVDASILSLANLLIALFVVGCAMRCATTSRRRAGGNSCDASQQTARGPRDHRTIAGDEEFESSLAGVRCGTAQLACDQCPARVCAEGHDHPLLAQRVFWVQFDAANAATE